MRLIITIFALAISTGTLKADEEHSFWWYTKAKIACLPDVTRLCASAMPSEDKVRNCMKDKKKLVSATCAEFFPGGVNAD